MQVFSCLALLVPVGGRSLVPEHSGIGGVKSKNDVNHRKHDKHTYYNP